MRPFTFQEVRHNLSDKVTKVTSQHQEGSFIRTDIMQITSVLGLLIYRLTTYNIRPMNGNTIRTRQRILISSIRSSPHRLAMVIEVTYLKFNSKHSIRSAFTFTSV